MTVSSLPLKRKMKKWKKIKNHSIFNVLNLYSYYMTSLNQILIHTSMIPNSKEKISIQRKKMKGKWILHCVGGGIIPIQGLSLNSNCMNELKSMSIFQEYNLEAFHCSFLERNLLGEMKKNV